MFIDPTYNPLDDVPLSVGCNYVKGIAKDGCEIYMPVASEEASVLDAATAQLQYVLDEQEIDELPPSPPSPPSFPDPMPA